MKLTKYPKINFVILKSVEAALLIFVPFCIGKLSAWLHVLTDCHLFIEAQDTILLTWIAGIGLIAFLICVAILSVGGYCLVQLNLEWAKELAVEDKE